MNEVPSKPRERILFITGRLAAPSLARVVENLRATLPIAGEIEILNITVAALMHVDWIGRKLELTERFDRAIVPGWCQGDLRLLEEKFGIPFERGPKDLFDLPEYFGKGKREPPDLNEYSLEILAEINHAPLLSDSELLAQARRLKDAGADLIDVGCIPGSSWSDAGKAVRLLRDEGLRVSIDSFDRAEVEQAVEQGAELVLSCNSTNIEWVSQLGVEVVAIPDTPDDAESLEKTVQTLQETGTPFRIDPILEPIGFGFAASLARYQQTRIKWPDCEIMLGVGNLTELSEVDSAGINFLLAGFCEELGIRSVLTTHVINWCRSAVAELDVSRRIMRHVILNAVLPKHLDGRLVCLRDARLNEIGDAGLQQLASDITDPNFRLFAEGGQLHLMNRNGYWQGTDPFELFDQILGAGIELDPQHAFYLGYELSKAVTALTLGKQYRQDQALDWGMHTVEEKSAHERRKQAKKSSE